MNLRKWNPGSLRHLDHRYSAKHLARVAPLVSAVAPTADQTLRLIEMQSRHSHSAPQCNFADGKRPLNRRSTRLRFLQLRGHNTQPLDLKFT